MSEDTLREALRRLYVVALAVPDETFAQRLRWIHEDIQRELQRLCILDGEDQP